MTKHLTGTREEWLAARLKLLEAEKELTRRSDELALAVPLWNFSIPYKLKNLIDVISQRGHAVWFDERGFGGLLHGRKALLICARGLDYAPSAATPARTYDFQKPYRGRGIKLGGALSGNSALSWAAI